MKYSVVTSRGVEIVATWINDHIEIRAYPVNSIILEWCFSLERAIERFNWYIEKYSNQITL